MRLPKLNSAVETGLLRPEDQEAFDHGKQQHNLNVLKSQI